MPYIKAYLFYHFLKWFLKDKKLGKRTLDKSKELLISRSYYVFEISENLEKDTYYTYHKGNPLRDLIKNCNDPRNHKTIHCFPLPGWYCFAWYASKATIKSLRLLRLLSSLNIIASSWFQHVKFSHNDSLHTCEHSC